MLEAVSKIANQRRAAHVLTLLVHFTLDGPNGTHSVLVTDIVVSIVLVLSPRRPPALAQSCSMVLRKL